ncbi:MAG: hypothetical protein FWD57_17235, partial [Polyangiaceae bacterium]|nr:hypothetical protein [Polyangiaceae bacterium]
PPGPSPVQERRSQMHKCAQTPSKCAGFPVENEWILQVRDHINMGFRTKAVRRTGEMRAEVNPSTPR